MIAAGIHINVALATASVLGVGILAGKTSVALSILSTTAFEVLRTATSSFSSSLATRLQVCRLAPHGKTLHQLWPGKLTSTPTCTQVWPRPHATTDLMSSPTGLKPWRRPSARTPTAIKRPGTSWQINFCLPKLLHHSKVQRFRK
jgi:hypothetical protein